MAAPAAVPAVPDSACPKRDLLPLYRGCQGCVGGAGRSRLTPNMPARERRHAWQRRTGGRTPMPIEGRNICCSHA
jgi:hypothetical protein